MLAQAQISSRILGLSQIRFLSVNQLGPWVVIPERLGHLWVQSSLLMKQGEEGGWAEAHFFPSLF